MEATATSCFIHESQAMVRFLVSRETALSSFSFYDLAEIFFSFPSYLPDRSISTRQAKLYEKHG